MPAISSKVGCESRKQAPLRNQLQHPSALWNYDSAVQDDATMMSECQWWLWLWLMSIDMSNTVISNDGFLHLQSHSGANGVYHSRFKIVGSFFEWQAFPLEAKGFRESPWLSLQQRCQVGSKVGDDAIEEAMVADVVATGPVLMSVPTGREVIPISRPRHWCGEVNHIPGIKSAVQSKSHRSSPLQSSILHSDCNFCSACTWSTQLSKAQQSCMSTTSEEASRLEAAHPYSSAEYSPWWTTIAQGHKRAMIYSSTRPHDHRPPRGCHLMQPCIGICKQNHLAVMFMENLPTSPCPYP